MGYDISQAKYEKLEKNRSEGRLCGGATMAKAGCSIRATRREITETWNYKIGEGVCVTHTFYGLCALVTLIRSALKVSISEY